MQLAAVEYLNISGLVIDFATSPVRTGNSFFAPTLVTAVPYFSSCSSSSSSVVSWMQDCTVLYCKLWTQAIASKSTPKLSYFFYITNRLPVPL